MARSSIYKSVDSINKRHKDFFKLLDQDTTIIEEDTKAEANIIHGFKSH